MAAGRIRWRRWAFGGALFLALMLFFLPDPEPDLPTLPGTPPFVWNQDHLWEELESRFRGARRAGCEVLRDSIDRGLARLLSLTAEIDFSRPGADHPLYPALEQHLFGVAPLAAVCSSSARAFLRITTQLRSTIKRQSRGWDVSTLSVRQTLYRLLYGSRAAMEEVILQFPESPVPALVEGEEVPSATPSSTMLGATIHSGDILVSRGGAPTSALIARGSDYPGNFSHIALVHVDSLTGVVSLIESHIERGVAVATVAEYLADTKLRVMVLRPRADLLPVVADPLAPHRAAASALAEARSRHIPYDFAMDFRRPDRLFCSEVASAAYRTVGIQLWMGMSSISSPGIASWLAAFGVRHFETQEPSDLEYDPQLDVVAEWRDPMVLFKDHVDNAVLDAMLEGAERGDRLTAAWYLLPVARVLTVYSRILNLTGRVGPVPEGMSSAAALKHSRFNARHALIKDEVLTQVGIFRTREGYTPPYWELVDLARNAAHRHPAE